MCDNGQRARRFRGLASPIEGSFRKPACPQHKAVERYSLVVGERQADGLCRSDEQIFFTPADTDVDLALGIAVVIATLFGPILAVWVTRITDARRERRARQLEVFRALMRSRRSNLSPEYVAALNTVEIEFAGVESIENAQRQLFQHLSLKPQPNDWIERLQRLQTRLLYTIAKHLQFDFEQLDVLEGGYLPQAWGASEEEAQAIRTAALQVLQGARAIKIQPTIIPNAATAIQEKESRHLRSGQMFSFRATGPAGHQSFGTIAFADGVISGADVTGGRYSGTYLVENNRMKITASVHVDAGTQLITGAIIENATSVPIKADWPADVPEAVDLEVVVGGQPIRVKLERLTKI